jgi:predicted Zn-dependent peptidase
MTEYLCDTLDNGLRVISVPMPHHHSAEVMIYIGVGSRHETTHKAGVSHFLEHMLFKGTEDFPSGLALERAFGDCPLRFDDATPALQRYCLGAQGDSGRSNG